MRWPIGPHLRADEARRAPTLLSLTSSILSIARVNNVTLGARSSTWFIQIPASASAWCHATFLAFRASATWMSFTYRRGGQARRKSESGDAACQDGANPCCFLVPGDVLSHRWTPRRSDLLSGRSSFTPATLCDESLL
jgi:hypothetical protein